MSYNNAQIAAINHNKGPAIVLAGPGSGKTTVITMRTKNLIDTYKVDPSNILVITFTKMAALEMKERFLKLTGQNSTRVTFGTFHAVFFTILKHAYNYSANNIIREEKQREFIKYLIEKYRIEIEDENDYINQILAEISRVKSEMIDIRMYYPINCSKELFEKIYAEYDNMLKRSKLIDFDDMLVYCYELLTKRPDILKAWQNKYKYILVDEFQDINKVQYDTVRLLAKPENNLFIVGDDDQSIYGFRGAKPEIMLNFSKDYENAKSITLDINYRSSSNIVNASKSVIDNNTRRYYKDIKTLNKPGKRVKILSFDDAYDENAYVISRIRKLIESEEYTNKDIAILTRTNIGGRQVIEKLIEYNIPFSARDVIPNLYEHWIARDIFTYIKLAMGNRDRKEFMQVCNRPNRYIGRDYLLSETIDFEELRKLYEEKQWMIRRLDDFEGDLNVLRKMNPFAAINYIRRGIGYDDYIKEYAEYRHINVDDLMNVLSEIQESAREFNTYLNWFEHIDEYTLELKKQAEAGRYNNDAVNICTMHGCKGLEYKVVFIIDANEGITPYNKAILDEEIEEERRMFYVAMTRAKEQLYILHTAEKYNKKQDISRFVSEIDEDYISEL